MGTVNMSSQKYFTIQWIHSSWEEAKATCMKENAHLLSIQTAKESAEVKEYLAVHGWDGFTNAAVYAPVVFLDIFTATNVSILVDSIDQHRSFNFI